MSSTPSPAPPAKPGWTTGLGSLAVMEFRRERNRLRRLLHRPGWLLFYTALAGGLLVMVMGAPPAAAPAAGGEETVFGGAAALWVLLSLAMRVWGGTSRPPFVATPADAALLLPSPISSRQVVLFQMGRAALGRLVTPLPFLILWVLILARMGLPLGRAGMGGFYLFMVLIGVWGDGIHAVTWLALERVPPGKAPSCRRRLRRILVAGAALGAGWLVWPVLSSLGAGWGSLTIEAAARAAFEQARLLAALPPFGWVTHLFEAVFAGGSVPFPTALGPVGVVALLWTGAVALGENYYESLVLQGEQDARIHQVTASWNVDVQGPLVQTGLLRRVRPVRLLPVRGRGAWALFWQQANRWFRLELGSWWMGLLGIGLLGVVLGGAVHAGLPSFWLPVVPAGLALVSAPWGYLAEELRRPYIYLIPAPAWKRLIAASLISFLDVFLSYGLMLTVAIGLAGEGAGALLTGLAILGAVAWLAQGALALTTVAVPSWFGRGARVLIQSIVGLVGLVPGAGAAWAARLLGGHAVVAGGCLVTLAAGAGLFAAAAALFHRAELAE